jgi:uncharacterized protein (TIRG00374 family)
MLGGKRGLALTSVGLVLFIAYLVYSNPLDALMQLEGFDVGLFLLSILINDVGLLLFAVSWWVLLRAMGVGVRLSEAVQATFISLFVVWMFPIPIGSEFIRAYLVRDKGNSGSGKAIASVVIHKTMYNISFGAIIALAAVVLTLIYGVEIPLRGDLLGLVLVFSIGSSVLFAVILNTRALRWLYGHSPSFIRDRLAYSVDDSRLGLGGFDSLVDEIGSAVSSLRPKLIHSAVAFAMVAFQWSTGSITAYLISLSLGHPVDFWLIVIIYAMVEFVQQFNIFIPGGLGVIDAGLTGAFVLVGVPLSMASAISLLTRLVTYWLEVVLAGFVSFHYGFRESLKEYLG